MAIHFLDSQAQSVRQAHLLLCLRNICTILDGKSRPKQNYSDIMRWREHPVISSDAE